MKSNLYTIVYMVILTCVFVSVVTVLHVATREDVALNERLLQRRQILLALDLTDNTKLSGKEAEELFRNYVAKFKTGRGELIYGALSTDGEVSAYAFPIDGSGFWGPVHGYLGVTGDGRFIKGISFTRHNETPGLGARIDEQRFREQFEGKDILESKDDIFIRLVPEGKSLNSKSVHAITGATRTSLALEKFLNDDIVEIKKLLEESDFTRVKD